MIIVTHEMQFARDVSSRIIFIDEGKILEDRPADTFFNDIKKERIKTFLKRYQH